MYVCVCPCVHVYVCVSVCAYVCVYICTELLNACYAIVCFLNILTLVYFLFGIGVLVHLLVLWCWQSSSRLHL